MTVLCCMLGIFICIYDFIFLLIPWLSPLMSHVNSLPKNWCSNLLGLTLVSWLTLNWLSLLCTGSCSAVVLTLDLLHCCMIMLWATTWALQEVPHPLSVSRYVRTADGISIMLSNFSSIWSLHFNALRLTVWSYVIFDAVIFAIRKKWQWFLEKVATFAKSLSRNQNFMS